MNFYKHYIGDYQRDTGHLSLTEHGAYRLMLDAFYATGKPLPADKRALYRLVRAGSRQERLAVDSVAAQFWQADGGGLVNRRACVEIARAEKQAGVNRQIALAREERRRLQRQLAADGDAAGEDGGAAGDRDDAHGCSGVSEVCKVNDTQVIYGLQPFMVTNRVTSGCTGEDAATVARSCAAGVSDGVQNGGVSRFGCPAAESPAAGRAGRTAGSVSRSGGAAVAGGAGNAVAGAALPVVFSADAGGDGVSSGVDDGVSAGALVGVLRRYGVVASASDPRVRTMVAQGVDGGLLASACVEARRVRPDERIGVAYVARIVERWLHDGVTGVAGAGRAGGRFRSCAADERREVLDVLTGRDTLDGRVSPVSPDRLTDGLTDGGCDGV